MTTRKCGETENIRSSSNEKMEVGGLRKMVRPKLRWSDVIRIYTKEK